MKNSKFCISLACMLFVLLPVYAEKVDLEKAEKLARRYVQLKQKSQTKTDIRLRFIAKKRLKNNPGNSFGLQSVMLQTAEERVCYYVFNINENSDGGFIIVAGDDAVRPVLGYSDRGSYDENKLPPIFTYWMDYLQQQIEYVQEHNLPQSETLRKEWDNYLNGTGPDSAKSATPLLQTTWDQNDPYRDSCPVTDDGKRTYTGCVATAMAQIMKYHRYPAHGRGESAAYITRSLKLYVPAVNFADANYDWDSMLDSYPNYSAEQQQSAVAKLMYHAGVSVQMDYTPTASGAYNTDVPSALTTYFGYDKSIKLRTRDFFDDLAWENLLKAQIDAGLPVYYSGSSGDGGHAFVCDGYDSDGKFHFNWGLNGYCDGYYVTTALDPETENVGAGSYSMGQTIVIDIKPDRGGTAAYEIALADDFSSRYTSALPGENFTVSAGFMNVGQAASSVPSDKYGIALVDDKGRIVEIVGSGSGSLLIRKNYPTVLKIPCVLPGRIALGRYKLKAVAKTADDDWKIVTMARKCPNSIDFRVGNPISTAGIHLNKSETAIPIGSPEQLIATVTPADATNKNVLWSSSDMKIATVNGRGLITAQTAAGMATITAETWDGRSKATCTVTVTNRIDATSNILLRDAFSTPVASALQNVPFTVSAGIENQSHNSVAGLGVALMNDNDEILEVIGTYNFYSPLLPHQYFNVILPINCRISDRVAFGPYKLKALANVVGKGWKIMANATNRPDSIDIYVGSTTTDAGLNRSDLTIAAGDAEN